MPEILTSMRLLSRQPNFDRDLILDASGMDYYVNSPHLMDEGHITYYIGSQDPLKNKGGDNVQYIPGKHYKFTRTTDPLKGKWEIFETKYTGGDGVIITGNNIKAKLDTLKPNYISNSAEGLLVNKMGAQVTKLSQDIKIGGGPLADSAPASWNGVLSKDMDIEKILKDLFCQAMDGDYSQIQCSLNPSLNKPSITTSISNGKYVEVGSKLNWSTSYNSPMNLDLTKQTFNFTDGYSKSNTTVKNEGTVYQPAHVIRDSGQTGSNWELKTTLTNITGGGNETKTSTNSTNLYKPSTEMKTSYTGLTIKDGTNSLTSTVTSHINIYVDVKETPKLYVLNNLGELNSNKKVASKGAYTISKVSQVYSNSNTTNIYGVYPFYCKGKYINANTKPGQMVDGNYPNPVKYDLLNYVGGYIYVNFPKHSTLAWTLYLAPGYNLVEAITQNPSNGEYDPGENHPEYFKTSGTESLDVAGGKVQYTKMVYTGTNGASGVKIKITR